MRCSTKRASSSLAEDASPALQKIFQINDDDNFTDAFAAAFAVANASS